MLLDDHEQHGERRREDQPTSLDSDVQRRRRRARMANSVLEPKSQGSMTSLLRSSKNDEEANRQQWSDPARRSGEGKRDREAAVIDGLM